MDYATTLIRYNDARIYSYGITLSKNCRTAQWQLHELLGHNAQIG